MNVFFSNFCCPVVLLRGIHVAHTQNPEKKNNNLNYMTHWNKLAPQCSNNFRYGLKVTGENDLSLIEKTISIYNGFANKGRDSQSTTARYDDVGPKQEVELARRILFPTWPQASPSCRHQ